jgi:hypothetical protein
MNMNNEDRWAMWSIGATGVAMVLFIAYAVHRVFHVDVGFASVAILILVGLGAFIGIMNILSVSAHLMKIIDPKQPFGLPEGSVRAILTIAFIVLVGVLASFLLTNSGERTAYGDEIVMEGVAAKDVDATVQRLSVEGLVSVARTADANAPVTVKFWPKQDYRLADDVSKQILTMLSTILAAMIGFYFGAQTPGAGPSQRLTDDSAERASIKTELDGLAGRAQAVRTAADDKLKADATKQPTIDPIKASLTQIDDKIAAARTAADDTSVPIERVRAAATEGKTAAAALDELKRKIDAA